MNERQNYLKLRANRESLGSAIIGLQNDISKAKAEMSPLEEEALRLELLGDPAYKRKREELAENRKKTEDLERDLLESQKKVKILNSDLLLSLREKAKKELMEEWRKRFGKVLKSFAEKLEEACLLEKDLAGLRAEAQKDFSEIDSHADLPTWSSILVRKFVGSPELWEEEIRRWMNGGFLD